ncbi:MULTISPECIES: hypothetical protein [unclassified Oleiphilus]|jgi:hypothetical protein|nr:MULTISPECIES: hypothetical protein [unclassified Oleiphilus]KZY47310.1 hypothetical protein A3732_06765 [Oleiphilus sp. HI0050]KZY76417.1 hypothetical protein A3741_11040 [Oleiphilus sp. HI0069]KZY78403.1 hypothetical protein A3740_07640 [Oleiphilus sp. HI0068]KZZ14825.1 hypothetical protein A3749_05245 [Oleiphilus sp. HI0078]KZZ21067.1 hypothetical protein A3752_01270 [Oleiphilus sp. HI0081]KZZ30943.1 hypothetical protein A3755_12815 [Oleiphilus sp. HI0085]
MEFPSFIDIEYSTPDEGGFPTAITWSLANGQIKSVLIIPDDEWDPWDNTDSTVDLQFLFDQGVSGPDVIRELNQDLDGQTVFIDGLDEDEALLELLFETYNNELGFEIASITQLFSSHPLETLLAKRNDLAIENQLDIDSIEDNVRALLHLSKEILT